MKRGRPTNRAVAARARRAQERAARIVSVAMDASSELGRAADEYVAAKRKGIDAYRKAVEALELQAERFTDAIRRRRTVYPPAIPLPTSRGAGVPS